MIPPGVSRLADVPVELGREQRRTRPLRVGRIHDHHVEALGALGGEARAVGDHHARPGVVERAGAQRGQPSPAECDHALVDLDLGDTHDALMPERLAQAAAVAATDDQDLAGAAVRQDRHMDDHLMIAELVAGRGLDHAVQGQNATPVVAFENDQVLEHRVITIENFLDADSLTPVGV